MAEPPLPLRKNGMNSKEKAVRVWYRRQGCKFSSSASAQVSPNPNILQRQIHSSNSQALSRWRGFCTLEKSSIKRLPSFRLLLCQRYQEESRSVGENVDTDFCYFKSSWKNFTFSELLTATNNFSKGTTEDQIISFLTEIGTIAHVNHPNTAKLIGFGVQGGTYVVLQLSPLGSLGSLLRGSKEKLNWAVRYKIILGTAAGLLYLHMYCQRRIIHRDIKADNILLTEDFEPQIYDFGLHKMAAKEWTHHTVSKFEGTFGYFAQVYFMYGIVDEKTDVFSFGVLLIEVITGREALDDSQQSLVLWVVILLRGENYFGVFKECQKRYLQRTFSEELLDAEEYNSTKYFSDLNRHKEVALGS
ncbi:Receptor-like cytosolic serine/threonine-protein kinase RBK2 [Camellia lanceoleosa]|nr:Receptor-like cytosolic serine/threonine-protein kinase RBK2 [Camellia lanceoleosa]